MGNTLQLVNWYWWRNRFSIIVMISFVIIAQSMFWMTGHVLPESYSPMVGVLLGISMLASTFSAINVFTAGRNLDLTSGKSAFPEWLYSLPISSLKLALVPVIGMLVSIAWAWLPFALTIRVSDSSIPILDLFVLPFLGIAGAASWLQALSWSPFKTGWHRLFIIVVAMTLVAGLVAVGSILPVWFRNTAFFVVAVCGLFAAIVSVFRARYRGWKSEAATIETASESVATKINLNIELRSTMSALLWRDWNRLGRIVPCLMLMISIPTLLFVIFATPSAETMLLIFVAPIFLLGLVGTTLGKDAYFKGQFEWPQCLSSLPVSNREFLQSRLLNCFRISIVMWSMAAIVFIVWMLKPGNFEQLQQLASSLEQMFPSRTGVGWAMLTGWLLFTLYVATVASLPSMVLGLCGRKYIELIVVILASLIGLVTIVGGSIYVTDLLGRLTTPELRTEYLNGLYGWIPVLLVCLLIGKLAIGALSIWVAKKRVGFVWRQEQSRFIVGSLACLALVTIFCWLIPPSFSPITYTATVVVLLFPFAAFFLALSALDWNRHR